jgi:nucleotide-binding universal stress UspA family protein
VVPAPGDHGAERIAAEGHLRAAKVLDDSRVESAVIAGYAPAALVRESRGAALVVVGHPGRDRAREDATGSVAFAVATHSLCDVVVVPAGDTVGPGPDRPVVVGVDGSDGANRAARRAAQIASERGAILILVQAWHGRTDEGRGPDGGSHGGSEATVPLEAYTYFESAARHSVDETAAHLTDLHPALTDQRRVVEAPPVSALVDASEGAGLLVVGRRSLDGFRRMLLGSVSRATLRRADVPLLVVRG